MFIKLSAYALVLAAAFTMTGAAAQVGNTTGYGSSVDQGLTVGGQRRDAPIPPLPRSPLGSSEVPSLRTPTVTPPPLPSYPSPNPIAGPSASPSPQTGNIGAAPATRIPPAIGPPPPTTLDGAVLPGSSQYPVGSPRFSMGQ